MSNLASKKLTSYPLFKFIVEETEDRKVSLLKIFKKQSSFAEWGLEYETDTSIHMEIDKVITAFKEKSNFLKKSVIEKFPMFSISDICFKYISYDQVKKIIVGEVINKTILDYFTLIDGEEESELFQFNIVDHIMKSTIKFYEIDETIKIGKFTYLNGELYV